MGQWFDTQVGHEGKGSVVMGSFTQGIEVREHEDARVTVLAVHGDQLNYPASKGARDAFMDICRKRAEQNSDRFALDLSGAGAIDSTGWSALIAVHKALRDRDAQFVLAGASPSITRVVAVMKLDRVFDVYPDIDAAVIAMS